MTRFCTECGAPRQHPDERFCGSCGAAHEGATAATPAPAYPVPPTAPAAAPPTAPYAAYGAPYAAPQSPVDRLEPDAARPRRRPGLRAGAVAAAVAVALAGAGVVVWQVAGPTGGAAAPDEAVEQLVGSLVEQDVVAALSMVAPGEVRDLDEVYDAAADRLTERGLMPDGRVTDAVVASVTDLELETTELGDDLAIVSLAGGSYEVTLDPDKLPDALDPVRDEMPDETYTGDILEEIGYGFPDRDWDDDEPEPYLVTVRVDGRWYVSALATMVDWAYGGLLGADGGTEAELRADFAEEGVRMPDPEAVGEDVEPIVGEDAEEVMGNLASAISRNDVEDLFANLPQDQVRALRPYLAPLQDGLRAAEWSFDAELLDLDAESEPEGDLVRVTIDEAAATIGVTDNGGHASATGQLSGTCGSGSVSDDGYEYDEGAGCLPGGFVDTLGIEDPFVMLREVDGGYQLDPIATATAYARDVVTSVSDRVLDELLDSIAAEDGYAACLTLGLGDWC